MSSVALSVVNSIAATASQTAVGGTVNDPIVALANNPILPGTGSFVLPSGNTAARLLQGAGSMRFNSQTGFFECSTDGATWVNLAVGGGGIASVTGTALQIDCTAGPNVVVSIDPGYLGQNSITTLGTITTGIWHGTAVDETHGGTNQTNYILGDTLYASGANTLAKLAGNITNVKQYLSQTGTGAVSAAPSWATISGADITGAALTKVDDANVTLTLGGTPNTALLRAASITAGWNGQLSLARGGTNAALVADNGAIPYSTGAAIALLASTVTASKMLLSGASAAPTWSTSTIPTSAGAVAGKVLASDGTNYVLSTATFPVAAGAAGTILRSDGTNWVASTATFANTYTASDLLYSNGANTVTGLATANNGLLVTSNAGVPSILAGPGTTGNILQSNAAAAPSFSTATYPSTTTINQLLYSSAANTVGGLATANSAVLVTTSAGVPGFSGTMTSGQLIIGSTGATPVAASLTAGANITITPGAGSITIAAAASAAAASKTDQITGTSTTVYVNPGVQQYHASAAKVWVEFTEAGTIQASYNVTSVTDNGNGSFTPNFTVSFTSANYCSLTTSEYAATAAILSTGLNSGAPQAAGSANVLVVNSAGTPTDPPGHIFYAAFGTQ